VAGGRDLDRGKVKQLVLYLSRASAEDEGYGMVKLNKLLFRADTEAWRLLGSSITGAHYQREDHGPVLTGLQDMTEELVKDKRAKWGHRQRGPKLESDYLIVLEDPDPNAFTPEQEAIIDRALDELSEHGGKSVSLWSHREIVAWRMLKNGEEIPYETTIVASGPAPKKAVARLRARVLSGNWD
jgi:hypothetical protein